jgi:hypothetical protein
MGNLKIFYNSLLFNSDELLNVLPANWAALVLLLATGLSLLFRDILGTLNANAHMAAWHNHSVHLVVHAQNALLVAIRHPSH